MLDKTVWERCLTLSVQFLQPSIRFLAPLILHSGSPGCWSLSQFYHRANTKKQTTMHTHRQSRGRGSRRNMQTPHRKTSFGFEPTTFLLWGDSAAPPRLASDLFIISDSQNVECHGRMRPVSFICLFYKANICGWGCGCGSQCAVSVELCAPDRQHSCVYCNFLAQKNTLGN